MLYQPTFSPRPGAMIGAGTWSLTSAKASDGGERKRKKVGESLELWLLTTLSLSHMHSESTVQDKPNFSNHHNLPVLLPIQSATMKIGIIIATIISSISVAQTFTPPTNQEPGIYAIAVDEAGNEVPELIILHRDLLPARGEPASLADAPKVNARGRLFARDQSGVSFFPFLPFT